jgi:hypothetical protein
MLFDICADWESHFASMARKKQGRGTELLESKFRYFKLCGISYNNDCKTKSINPHVLA